MTAIQQMTQAELYEDRRRQLWIWVATAVARSDSTRCCDTPADFADRALDRFDKRFAKPEAK